MSIWCDKCGKYKPCDCHDDLYWEGYKDGKEGKPPNLDHLYDSYYSAGYESGRKNKDEYHFCSRCGKPVANCICA